MSLHRRTGHNTTKSPRLTGGDDRPRPGCEKYPEVYDELHESSRTDAFKEATEAAQNLCGTCLLRSPEIAKPCLDGALDRKERWAHVVLGRPLKDDSPKRCAKATAQHGTDAGYFRHLRKTKDEPCDDCREAHAEAQAKYKRRRRGVAA